MWSTFLFTSNLFSSLSALWAMSFLSSLLAAGLWLAVAVKKKSQTSNEPLRDKLNTSLKQESYLPQPDAVKMLAVLVFSSFAIGSFVYVGSNARPVYEYHDVHVLRRIADNKWLMWKPDGGQFVWAGCPDYDNASIIWPGYIMDKFRYEDHGICNSIAKPELGVWWKRDPETQNVITLQEN